WADLELGRNSMILAAEKVLPILQEATKAEADWTQEPVLA
ncbi:MAG: hypothetical protein ACJASV_002728, partial [Pseudorhodobacter sp.]